MALIVLALLICGAYEFRVQAENAYIGMRPITPSLSNIAMAVIFVIFSLLYRDSGLRRPSDSLFIFFLLAILPFSILFSTASDEAGWFTLVLFFCMVLPVVIIKIIPQLTSHQLGKLAILPYSLIYLVCLVCCGVVLVALSSKLPVSASFGLDDVYVRRLEVRHIIVAQSPMAYALSSSTNGLIPLAAFVAGYKRSIALLIPPVLMFLGFFYFAGVKAPLFIACTAYIFGCTYKNRERFFYYFTGLLVALFGISLVEILINDYSYLLDYVIRRVFIVPSFLVASYAEFLGSIINDTWSPINGFDDGRSVAYAVGEFLGRSEMNANSNSLVTSFAGGGIASYLVDLGLIVGIYSLLDSAFRINKNPAVLFAGLLVAILLIEQRVTTMMLSSGVFVVLSLCLFSRSDRERESVK